MPFIGSLLPRSQTSLSLRKGWAPKGWREGERMRDVWQILFSRWRNVQWRMITQFSKRSIDLFVLRILKERWFFLIQCARRGATSEYPSTPFTCVGVLWRTRNITIVAILIQWDANKWTGILKFSRSQCICYTLVACWSTAEAKKPVVISVYLQLVCEISTEIDCTGKEPNIVHRSHVWQCFEKKVVFSSLFCIITRSNYHFSLMCIFTGNCFDYEGNVRHKKCVYFHLVYIQFRFVRISC